MLVRPATEADLPAINDLYNELIPTTTTSWSEEPMSMADRHGQGMGRALILSLLDAARAQGLHVLVAAVDADTEGSLAFHRALGFTEVARMPEVGFKFGRRLDLVLLQRFVDA